MPRFFGICATIIDLKDAVIYICQGFYSSAFSRNCRKENCKVKTIWGVSTQKLFSFRVLLFFSYRKYRPIGRYYRSELPEVLPEPSTAYESWVLDSNGSTTGSSTGTTAKPEVPVLPAVLPPGTSGVTSGAQCRLRKLGTGLLTEVAPEVVPVLPLNRNYRSVSRYYRPRGLSLLAVGRLFLGGPEVPPFGPVLPVLRVFASKESRWGCFHVGR